MDHPRSALARAAREHVESTLSPGYFRHSMRTYGCAQAVARARDIRFDEEGLFVAAMFHDVGLFPPFRDRSRPFQLVSSQQLREFLDGQRISMDRADILAAAIEYHVLPVPRWSLSNEAGLLQVGAWMDAISWRRWSVPEDAAGLDREFPRAGLIREAVGLVARSLGSPASLIGLWMPGLWRKRGPKAP